MDNPYRAPACLEDGKSCDSKEASWLYLVIGMVTVVITPAILYPDLRQAFDPTQTAPIPKNLFWFAAYFAFPLIAFLCGYRGSGSKSNLPGVLGILICILAAFELMQVVVGVVVYWVGPV
jgi:hypothetical protein